MTVSIGSARVRLETWDDLVSAAQEGLIDERIHCELKKGLPPSKQNTEVSCDLASLSVEGGVLIYGIEDAGSGRAGEVVGVVDPPSTKKRLVGIADGLIQPSLVCDVLIVENPSSPERGCVLVVVPPSPMSPHRADERYWGRSAEGKRVLSDAEAAFLFDRRRNRRDDFLEHLHSLEREFDPYASGTNGHFYLSARPLEAHRAASGWGSVTRLAELIVAASVDRGRLGGVDFWSLMYDETHPDGIQAVTRSRDQTDARGLLPPEEEWLRVLVQDTGAIDLAFCGATHQVEQSGSLVWCIPFYQLVVYTHQAAQLAGKISDLFTLNGTWRFGVRATRLKGKADSWLTRFGDRRPSPYPTDEYVRVVDVPAQMVRDAPQEVVEKVLAGLQRGLGLGTQYLPMSPSASQLYAGACRHCSPPGQYQVGKAIDPQPGRRRHVIDAVVVCGASAVIEAPRTEGVFERIACGGHVDPLPSDQVPRAAYRRTSGSLASRRDGDVEQIHGKPCAWKARSRSRGLKSKWLGE